MKIRSDVVPAKKYLFFIACETHVVKLQEILAPDSVANISSNLYSIQTKFSAMKNKYLFAGMTKQYIIYIS